MAPVPVLDYIITHEMVHLKYPNHSAEFWNELDKKMPKYREHEEWLKRMALRWICNGMRIIETGNLEIFLKDGFDREYDFPHVSAGIVFVPTVSVTLKEYCIGNFKYSGTKAMLKVITEDTLSKKVTISFHIEGGTFHLLTSKRKSIFNEVKNCYACPGNN